MPRELELDRDLVIERLVRYLGYDPDENNRNDLQQKDLDDIVDSGYRAFLFPIDPTNGRVFKWSFLYNDEELSFAEGESEYPCPDDFGSVQGYFTYIAPEKYQKTIEFSTEQEIRKLYQDDLAFERTVDDFPILIATKFKHIVEEEYEKVFLVYPKPTAKSAGYTVQFRYEVLITEYTLKFLGGVAHSETILSACLAAAERTMEETIGIHEQRFRENLIRSIAYDKERHGMPRKFGRMGGYTKYGCEPVFNTRPVVTHQNQIPPE